MELYYLIVGYFFLLLAIGLLFYRLWLVSTGNKLPGVVNNVVIRNSTLTGKTKSKHVEIYYKNSSGIDCQFLADNGLLVFLYKIGDPVMLSERNGRVIVDSWFNIITAPAFIFLMGYLILNFFA